MDSPTSPSDMTESSTRRFISRSGMMDSFRGFSLSGIGIRVEKEELRSRILIPQYLRISMRDCIHKKDIRAGEPHFRIRGETFPPESPIVVFVNGRSGGRNGPLLKERLLRLMDEDQIFDLSEVKPYEFVQYALGCLEHLSTLGDDCAKETREKMRVVVAGGDGTVGWVLGSLGELFVTDRGSFPPVAIIPLGTGNDLARTFGWGGAFSFAWKSAVKKAIYRATSGPVCRLDSWHMSIQMPSEEVVDPPHSLKSTKDSCLSEGLPFEGKLPEKAHFYEGVFYNYFSIGMDAQVAYGFHQLRNEKPYLAQGPVANKIIYSGYSCTQGWFLTPCMNDPRLRGLKNIVRMYIRKIDSSEWELIHVPKSVRAIVALNLHNYGSGRNPWGNLSPEYLEKRGFVEPQVDDGLLEIFGLKQGWHASFVMVELISAKHIAQAASIRLELRGGEWKDAYLQMDGEPWKQPLSQDYSTFLEIKRVPYQSVMVSGE